tara:strand:- start:9993 stop:10910 length:918 start_codon:yes stop_codon:yes gene_type:complete
MKKATRTLDVIAARKKGTDAIIPGELANLHFPKENGLSLLAWKMLVRVIDEAGARICDDREHRLEIAALNWSHKDLNFIEDTLRELQRTIVDIQIDTSRGKKVQSGSILTDVTRDLDTATGEILWEFSKTFRAVVKNSHHWAAVGAKALLHMESKYAPPLYMLAALYAGRRHNSVEIPLYDLQQQLGARAKSMKRWQAFKERALDPAVAEINHLTGIRLDWEPVKRGRKIVAVTFTAWRKDSAQADHAVAELSKTRIGRKARRAGTVEELAADQVALREMAERSLLRASEAGQKSIAQQIGDEIL